MSGKKDLSKNRIDSINSTTNGTSFGPNYILRGNNIKMVSKKIIDLEKGIYDRNIHAIDLFWEEVNKTGYPLIEKIENDNEHSLVTFLYKEEEETANIVLHGTGIGFEYMKNRMEKIENTNIWYKTYKLRNDIEFVYWLSINDALDDDSKKRHENFTIDSLNLHKFIMKDDPEKPVGKDFVSSYVKMPLVKPKRWINEQDMTHKGKLEKHIFKSEILENERRVWVYTPHNYDKDNDEYNLMVLNDGNSYVKWLGATTVLDNLIQEGIISPIVVVFISSSETRFKELTFNRDFSKFITDEILPFVYKKYSVTKDPKNAIIGGFSLGGLTAAYLGMNYPNLFGNVLSQSGSLFWKCGEDGIDEWLIHQYEKTPKLPIKFFITYGILENTPIAEPTLIQSNEKFVSMLIDKGYEVNHLVFKSGHDYLNWGETLAEGLISLIGLDK